MTNDELIQMVTYLQRSEATEKQICLNISQHVKDKKNRRILIKIAAEEQQHYEKWKRFTGKEAKPFRLQVFFYSAMAVLLGYTFAIKQMEARLNRYQNDEIFAVLLERFPEITAMHSDVSAYEDELIASLDEERLHYVGSMILGLNDALVEFTGSLAGYTFAMQSNKLIAMAGLITGISATLAMASSEYLSTRSEIGKNASRAAMYTGISYLLTVILLLLPYLTLPDKMYGTALIVMLVFVVIIIAAFNYYIAIAQNLSFKQRFIEMTVVSLSVAAVSFLIGLLVKNILGIDLS